MAGYVDIVKASGTAVRVRLRVSARYLRNERDMEKWDLEGKGSRQLLHLTSGDLSPHVHFVAAATCPKSTDATPTYLPPRNKETRMPISCMLSRRIVRGLPA